MAQAARVDRVDRVAARRPCGRRAAGCPAPLVRPARRTPIGSTAGSAAAGPDAGRAVRRRGCLPGSCGSGATRPARSGRSCAYTPEPTALGGSASRSPCSVLSGLPMRPVSVSRATVRRPGPDRWAWPRWERRARRVHRGCDAPGPPAATGRARRQGAGQKRDGGGAEPCVTSAGRPPSGPGLSPRGRPAPGTVCPRRRTTSCATPSRPARAAAGTARAGRPV